ncbi:unnamed protein product, partial [Laminaria digitata]
MPEKYYVAGLHLETSTVIVARGASHPSLFAEGLSALASEFNWPRGPSSLPVPSPERRLLRCLYRCRHRQELLPCTVEI